MWNRASSTCECKKQSGANKLSGDLKVAVYNGVGICFLSDTCRYLTSLGPPNAQALPPVLLVNCSMPLPMQVATTIFASNHQQGSRQGSSFYCPLHSCLWPLSCAPFAPPSTLHLQQGYQPPCPGQLVYNQHLRSTQ